MNVKINKHGVNIKNGGLTVQNSNGTVIIDGSSNMFKIHSTVEVNIEAGTNLKYVYRLPHNLGYVPAYLAFQVGTYSVAGDYTNTLLPAITLFSATSDQLGVSAVLRANADTNDIIINYIRANTNVKSNVRVKLFILKEALI